MNDRLAGREAEPSEVPCPTCGAPRRSDATFCGACGAGWSTSRHPTSPGLQDGLARAVLFEAEVSDVRASPVRGLSVALLSYFAVLAVSATPAFVALEEMSDYRMFDALITLVGVVGVALTWRTNLELVRLPRITRRSLIYFFGGLALVLGIAHVMLLLAPSADARLFAAYRAEGRTLAYVLVDVGVLPAVGEELVFRGVILSALFHVFRVRTAVVVSALLFATIHLSPLSFVHLSAMGIVLGFLRLETGSLYPCMLFHGVYNCLVVLIAW